LPRQGTVSFASCNHRVAIPARTACGFAANCQPSCAHSERLAPFIRTSPWCSAGPRLTDEADIPVCEIESWTARQWQTGMSAPPVLKRMIAGRSLHQRTAGRTSARLYHNFFADNEFERQETARYRQRPSSEAGCVRTHTSRGDCRHADLFVRGNTITIVVDGFRG
jgi:hypothetical protein